MYCAGMCGNGSLERLDRPRSPWAVDSAFPFDVDPIPRIEDDGFGMYMWGDREPFRGDPDLWNLDPGSEPPLVHAYHATRAIERDAPGARVVIDPDRVLFSRPGTW